MGGMRDPESHFSNICSSPRNLSNNLIKSFKRVFPRIFEGLKGVIKTISSWLRPRTLPPLLGSWIRPCPGLQRNLQTEIYKIYARCWSSGHMIPLLVRGLVTSFGQLLHGDLLVMGWKAQLLAFDLPPILLLEELIFTRPKSPI